MKRYIKCNKLLVSHSGKNLADAFIAECEPYHFFLLEEYPDCYQIVGVPDPATETVYELIQLVEGICKYYDVEFFDSHIGQGDQGDFIVFKICK